MNTAVIGLGSNIDPENNIKKAREALKNEFKVLAESQFIRTKPVGYVDQADFINGSVHIETDDSLEALTSRLKSLETQLGRQRSDIKSGPRSIDLDVVIFNRKIIDKDFYDRDFIKNASLELIPDLEY